jgi:hypothetical protein
MLAADRLDHASLDQEGTELGEGPAPVGEAQFVRGHFGKLADGGPLLVGQALGGPQTARLPHRGQSLSLEGMEVRVDGVGVGLQEGSDLRGAEASCVEQQDLCAAALPRGEFLFEAFVQLPEFGSGRLADR